MHRFRAMPLPTPALIGLGLLCLAAGLAVALAVGGLFPFRRSLMEVLLDGVFAGLETLSLPTWAAALLAAVLGFLSLLILIPVALGLLFGGVALIWQGLKQRVVQEMTFQVTPTQLQPGESVAFTASFKPSRRLAVAGVTFHLTCERRISRPKRLSRRPRITREVLHRFSTQVAEGVTLEPEQTYHWRGHLRLPEDVTPSGEGYEGNASWEVEWRALLHVAVPAGIDIKAEVPLHVVKGTSQG